METPKRLHIGLFEEDQVMLEHIHSLLSLAEHTVSVGKEQESLELFLAKTIRRLKRLKAPMYDLLIISIPAVDLMVRGKTFNLLVQLISLDRFPVILLTDAEDNDLERIKTSVPKLHLLSCSPLYQYDLFQTIAAATGTPTPRSLAFLRGIEKMQREQLSRMQHTEQAWINRRQEWLDQRQEWQQQRLEWLKQRQAWLSEQRRGPDCQKEWLDEQQEWVRQQYEEVEQQCKWIEHLRLWLNRYQKKLDRQEGQPPLSEAQ
ncbi:MAG TPA: hypothetical protein VFU49_23865 [Ktedonobacteraceae bacterium]|nr:hypothetical protein [Ktedonobacteraceae bacterium]